MNKQTETVEILPGMSIRVTGSKIFAGKVKAVSDIILIIDRGLGNPVTLRRDPASTTPLQWRCQGLPVHVILPDFIPKEDFKGRLNTLVQRTRGLLYVRTFDGANWFINDADGNVIRPASFPSEQAARDWIATYRPKCDVIMKRYDGVKPC